VQIPLGSRICREHVPGSRRHVGGLEQEPIRKHLTAHPRTNAGLNALPMDEYARPDITTKRYAPAMFVRLGSFAVKAGELDALRATYNDVCVPIVRAAEGSIDCFLLEPVEPGEIVACTMWRNEDDAVRYESSGRAQEVVAKVRQHFAGPPRLVAYRVIR